MDEITAKVEQLKVEDQPRVVPKKEEVKPKQEESKPKPQPKPKASPSPPNDADTKDTKSKSKSKSKPKSKPKPKQNEEEKKPEPEKKKEKKKKKKVIWDAHDPREHLNLVLIGHVDAGKSTISGQILYVFISTLLLIHYPCTQ